MHGEGWGLFSLYLGLQGAGVCVWGGWEWGGGVGGGAALLSPHPGASYPMVPGGKINTDAVGTGDPDMTLR